MTSTELAPSLPNPVYAPEETTAEDISLPRIKVGENQSDRVGNKKDPVFYGDIFTETSNDDPSPTVLAKGGDGVGDVTDPPILFYMVTATRNRRATEGWFDVVKEDGNEWIDTPPQASTAILTKPRQAREARERAFMLQERFKKAVHRLPPDCVAEAKAGASLSALQYGTGQVLVKRALRGLDDLPAFLIVPTEPHPDHKAAVESLGVKVVVP